MTPFDAWLDARDGQSLAAAWAALAPPTLEPAPAPVEGIGILGWYRTGHAAAQLASAWLSTSIESVAWLAASDNLDDAGAPPPAFKVRRNVELSFLEHCVNERHCFEEWDLREVRAGHRLVQRVHVAWGRSDGSRDGGEGGRGTVMRFVDREQQMGACIRLHSRTVSLIGDVNVDRVIALLDLFDFNPNFRIPAWTTYDLDRTRGLIAQLATEVDAHYDESASWDRQEVSAYEDRYRELRFAKGTHAIHVEERPNDGTIDVRLEGLPRGHQLRGGLRFTPDGAWGHFNARFPEDAATRMHARLRLFEGLKFQD